MKTMQTLFKALMLAGIITSSVQAESMSNIDSKSTGGNMEQKTVSVEQLAANKKLVLSSYDNNFNQKNSAQVAKFINPDQYIQHAINGKDGVQGLIKYIEYMKAEMPSFTGKNIRMIADGDLVVSQTEELVKNKPVDISMDLYRIKDGKIVEHWDAVQKYTDQKPLNKNGIVAGAQPNQKSLLASERVKEVAHEYFTRTWGKLDVSAIDQYVAPNFIQHNPQVADGREALKTLVSELNSSKTKIKVEIARILVEKDFAVVHAKWTDDSGSYALFDILRLNDQYQIVEHWDVMGEQIPASNTNSRDAVF